MELMNPIHCALLKWKHTCRPAGALELVFPYGYKHVAPLGLCSPSVMGIKQAQDLPLH